MESPFYGHLLLRENSVCKDNPDLANIIQDYKYYVVFNFIFYIFILRTFDIETNIP